MRLWTCLLAATVVALQADAAVEVCPPDGDNGAPSTASCNDGYLIVWHAADRPGNPSLAVAAARVTKDLVVSDPGGFVVEANVRATRPEVASTGTNYLVVWDSATPSTGWHNIQGRLVYPDGSRSDLIVITTGGDRKDWVAVAASSQLQLYLVVWQDARNDGIYAARVTSSGTVCDPEGFPVTIPPAVAARPRVASDGNRFLVIWYDGGIEARPVKGAFVSATGPAEPPIVISETPMDDPDVDFGGGSYILVWSEAVLRSRVFGRVFDSNGIPRSEAVVLRHEPVSWLYSPRASYCLADFLVSWRQQRNAQPLTRAVCAQRVSPAGMVVGPFERVALGSVALSDPDVASDRETYYMMSWSDGDIGQTGVYADTVPHWQRHFYTESPCATAYNNSRHVALDPVTGWLHLVYEDSAIIRYSFSTDKGQSWAPTEVVGWGSYPSIVCENQERNHVWVAYTLENGLSCRTFVSVRVGPQGWWAYEVCHEGARGDMGPSLSMCYEPAPNDVPSVYVVYATETNWPKIYSVVFDKVLYGQGVSLLDHRVLAQTELPDICSKPSVATTPGDWVHVAWELFAEAGDKYRILYLQRAHGQWEEFPEEVTEPVPGVEPAGWPSVEAYGDSVYAVWQGRNEQGTVTDVWMRARGARQSPWSVEYSNRSSKDPNLPSAFPQQSTPWATVWEEGTPQDIWTHCFDEIQPVHEDPVLSSRFPSIAAEWSGPGQPQEFWLHTVWTNALPAGQPAPYEVKYGLYTYAPPQYGHEDFVYYDCGVGDSANLRYCLARDGCARWRSFTVDYAQKGLRYRLPFLNPNFDYVLEAVLYQVSRDTWEQSFSIDSLKLAQVRFRPLVPETVLMTIPRELYARDCEVVLDVGRLAGSYAVVGGMKLFECFPSRRSDGGVQGGSIAVGVPVLRISRLWPSPFRNAATLSYALSAPRRVDVKVFDVQGRLVRVLSSGFCTTGIHHLRWNGLDDGGRRVPAGAYMVRVAIEDFSQTRKVVLAE